MKFSEVTMQAVADFLRLPEGSYSSAELDAIMAAAERYVIGYTGIPYQDPAGGKVLDDYEDLTIAYLVLCQDLYDQRTVQTDTAAANRTLDAILGMHARNLV